MAEGRSSRSRLQPASRTPAQRRASRTLASARRLNADSSLVDANVVTHEQTRTWPSSRTRTTTITTTSRTAGGAGSIATNHKDIGTLYLVFACMMFFIGGAMAMVIRAELFKPGLQFVEPEFFNSMTTMHALVMIFGAVMPALVGPGELDDPAAGRRAGHGAAAHEQLQLLDPAVRLHAAAVDAVRAGRRAGRRLDDVSAAGAAGRRRRSRW